MCTPAQKCVQRQKSINTLSHKPVQELSKEEVQERRTFPKEQLDVKIMTINQDQQDQVIDLFMKYFNAMSTNSKDFSSSDLLQFHITLLPGTHPV